MTAEKSSKILPNEIPDQKEEKEGVPNETDPTMQKAKSIAEVQYEARNPIIIKNSKEDMFPRPQLDKNEKIISRMQIKDLKPALQTCPLSEEARNKLKKESPFFVNGEELCTPERLLKIEMEKIPEKVSFKSEPLIHLRKIVKAYGNYKFVVQPLWYHFKKSDKFVIINFQSFARTDLVLKMIITNPKNFHVLPKITELKPLEKGTFELHYSREKLQKSAYNMLGIGWMSKDKWQKLKKTKVDFHDLCIYEGGMLVIPVTVEDYKEETNDESEDQKKESSKVESKTSNKSKAANKIKATTPFEVSSCSRVTQESRKQK